MPGEKVIIAGWSTVDPKRRDEVIASFSDLVLRARSAPGCLDFAISADAVDPARINVLELWESEKDWKAWRAACKPPKKITRTRQMAVQKYVV